MFEQEIEDKIMPLAIIKYKAKREVEETKTDKKEEEEEGKETKK